MKVEYELEQQKANCVLSNHNPERFLRSLLFKNSKAENTNWVEKTDEACIFIHTQDHGKVDKILRLGDQNVEEGLNVSDEHAEGSGELPGVSHLSELDSSVEGGHGKDVLSLVLVLGQQNGQLF